MSFGSWFSSEASDYDTGKRVLKAYFDEASNFSEFTYSTFDSWESYLNSRVPDLAAFVGELVKSNSASTTVDQAVARASDLANRSGGQASIPEIVKAAGGSGDTVNWSAGVPEILSESASDVLDIAQNVGEGVVGTLNVTKYLPWILGGVGALALYAYFSSAGKQTGRAVGAALSGLRK